MMGRPKYTLLMKVPLGVVGFFDGIWNEEQIASSASMMREQMATVIGPCSGMIRCFDFENAQLVQKVNMSPGQFWGKNTLIDTNKPL